MNLKDKNNDAIGHRQRLREKISTHIKCLADYELLEALLFYVFPRKDTKPQAKSLLTSLKNLRNVIFASPTEIKKIYGLGKSTTDLLQIISEIFSRILLAEVSRGPIIATSQNVINYYKHVMGSLKKEQLRVMFLDAKNQLVHEQIMQEGTINQTAIYPREIVQIALEHAASGIIMVHNHPSGDPSPSHQDIIFTERIKDVAEKLDIILLDHLIIGHNNITSFKELKLL